MSQEQLNDCDSWLVPFDVLIADVALYVPDAASEMIMYTLRQAAHEFLSRTHYAQFEFVMPLQAGVDMYELEVPDGYFYQKLLEAKDGCGTPVHVTANTDGWIHIARHIGGDFNELYCRVGLRPSRDITGVPKDIAEEWGETLAFGAVARLLLMKGQTWEDLPLGKDFEGKFKMGMRDARIRKYRGTQPGAMPMRSERWV